jgi:hydroxyacylglutathione hydrolase
MPELPFRTLRDSYLGIYTQSFVWQTPACSVFLDAGLRTGAAAREPYLDGRPCALLMTHGHWDHIGCCGQLQRRGAAVWAHPGDARLYCDHDWHWQLLFGQFEGDFALPPERRTVFSGSVGEPVTPDRAVQDGDILPFGPLRFRVIGLPGHSRGSVCYLEEGSGILFTGDGVMGRGFFAGTPQIMDFDDYFASLERLAWERVSAVVTDHTEILPGEELPALLRESRLCAERMLRSAETWARETRELSVGGAARAMAAGEGKAVGGGTCVSALAALRRMRDDPRAQACAARYL